MERVGGGESCVLVNDVYDAVCSQDVVDDGSGAVDEDGAGVGGDVDVLGDERGEREVELGWVEVGDTVRDDVIAKDAVELSLGYVAEDGANGFKGRVGGAEESQSRE